MKSSLLTLLAALLFTSLNSSFARADGNEPSPEERVEKIKQFEASLQWQQGSIDLKNGLAKLDVPKEFRYLNSADAGKVLRAWGNEHVDETLGMLFPAELSPFSENSWGVVISYNDDGHVKDDDAQSIDYTKLLADMQKELKDSEHPAQLIGWATPPRYDSSTHKMYWAKELSFKESTGHTLNYNIRILGKEGVLVLNAVSGMNQLKTIEDQTPALLSFVNFAGNRYEDFQPGVHKMAQYGLAGMVAAGLGLKLAAKVGLLKGLIALLLAFKKFIIVFLLAAVTFIKSRFGKKPQTETPPADQNPPTAAG